MCERYQRKIVCAAVEVSDRELSRFFRRGNIHSVKLIATAMDNLYDFQRQELFTIACQNNQFELAKWWTQCFAFNGQDLNSFKQIDSERCAFNSQGWNILADVGPCKVSWQAETFIKTQMEMETQVRAMFEHLYAELNKAASLMNKIPTALCRL